MVKNKKSQAHQAPVEDAVFEPNENDIIDDILRRVIALAPGFGAALAAQVDKEVREQWGGDRPYIGLRRGTGSSARNTAIRRDYWQNGEHIPLLERRYGLKARQLWYIIKS